MSAREFYLGDFEKIVLQAIISCGNNAYGVQIADELESKLGRDASFAAIYTTLDRLEKKGLLDSSKGEATAVRGGRAKTFFTVNGAGQAALRNSIETLRKMGLFDLSGGFQHA